MILFLFLNLFELEGQLSDFFVRFPKDFGEKKRVHFEIHYVCNIDSPLDVFH